jgi:hypothetical protein
MNKDVLHSIVDDIYVVEWSKKDNKDTTSASRERPLRVRPLSLDVRQNRLACVAVPDQPVADQKVFLVAQCEQHDSIVGFLCGPWRKRHHILGGNVESPAFTLRGFEIVHFDFDRRLCSYCSMRVDAPIHPSLRVVTPKPNKWRWGTFTRGGLGRS